MAVPQLQRMVQRAVANLRVLVQQDVKELVDMAVVASRWPSMPSRNRLRVAPSKVHSQPLVQLALVWPKATLPCTSKLCSFWPRTAGMFMNISRRVSMVGYSSSWEVEEMNVAVKVGDRAGR